MTDRMTFLVRKAVRSALGAKAKRSAALGGSVGVAAGSALAG